MGEKMGDENNVINEEVFERRRRLQEAANRNTKNESYHAQQRIVDGSLIADKLRKSRSAAEESRRWYSEAMDMIREKSGSMEREIREALNVRLGDVVLPLWVPGSGLESNACATLFSGVEPMSAQWRNYSAALMTWLQNPGGVAGAVVYEDDFTRKDEESKAIPMPRGSVFLRRATPVLRAS